jgi:hypothetical protein
MLKATGSGREILIFSYLVLTMRRSEVGDAREATEWFANSVTFIM